MGLAADVSSLFLKMAEVSILKNILKYVIERDNDGLKFMFMTEQTNIFRKPWDVEKTNTLLSESKIWEKVQLKQKEKRKHGTRKKAVIGHDIYSENHKLIKQKMIISNQKQDRQRPMRPTSKPSKPYL